MAASPKLALPVKVTACGPTFISVAVTHGNSGEERVTRRTVPGYSAHRQERHRERKAPGSCSQHSHSHQQRDVNGCLSLLGSGSCLHSYRVQGSMPRGLCTTTGCVFPCQSTIRTVPHRLAHRPSGSRYSTMKAQFLGDSRLASWRFLRSITPASHHNFAIFFWYQVFSSAAHRSHQTLHSSLRQLTPLHPYSSTKGTSQESQRRWYGSRLCTIMTDAHPLLNKLVWSSSSLDQVAKSSTHGTIYHCLLACSCGTQENSVGLCLKGILKGTKSVAVLWFTWYY